MNTVSDSESTVAVGDFVSGVVVVVVVVRTDRVRALWYGARTRMSTFRGGRTVVGKKFLRTAAAAARRQSPARRLRETHTYNDITYMI